MPRRLLLLVLLLVSVLGGCHKYNALVGAVAIRKLLPEPLPGLDLERVTLPPGARMAGVPHTPARAST